METKQNLIWTSNTKYVDIDTGELITKQECQKNYIIIKKQKHVQTTERYGTVNYTAECKRRIQPTATQTSIFDL